MRRQGPIGFSDPDFHRRELRLMGGRNATRQDFETVVAAMRGGRIPSAAIGTRHCARQELPTAMPCWLHDRAGVVKAIIRLPAAA